MPANYFYQDGLDFYDAQTGALIVSYADAELIGMRKERAAVRDIFLLSHPNYVPGRMTYAGCA